MELIAIKKECMDDYGKKTACIVFSVHVKVKDIQMRAEEMIQIISDRSWIDALGAVAKATFKARSERTILKLVHDILEQVEDEVTTDFGEFMVSETAQSILGSELLHIKVPLAELLKEKITGNPGFDFHTESEANLIVFGEAKYSGSGNPHGLAVNQIVDFIDLKKDEAELNTLQHFVTEKAINNSLQGKKAFVAAFSINSPNPMNIISNALKSNAIDELLKYPELYVIGVEVNA